MKFPCKYFRPAPQGLRCAGMRSLLILTSIVAAAFATPAPAQHYPRQPVRLLVGGAAGSVPDVLIRPIAERLGASLGQAVVVENRPGAAGSIAIDSLLRAPADGQTIALATMSQAVFNAYLFSKLPYDPLRDLQPVAPLVTGAMVLAAHPSLGVHSLKELVQRSRSAPDRLFVAMPQAGSPPHVVALLLNRAAGLEVTMVPHKSGAEALNLATSGAVPLVIDAPTIISPQVKAGRLVALVVTGREREAALPEVPTIQESGFPGVEGEAWIGIVARSGTAPDIVRQLNQQLQSILRTADIRELMAKMSFRTLSASPEQFAAMIRDDHAKWGRIIQEAGVKLD